MATSKVLCLAVLLLAGLRPLGVVGMKWQDGWTSFLSGNVFCDQCMKNTVFPFALPLHGAKVSVQCAGADGKMMAAADANTDIFGGFLVTFKGVEDMGGCRVYMKSSPDSSCNIVGNQGGLAVQLKTKLFFTSFYGVEPMFFKPPAPKSFCPGAPKPGPHPQPPRSPKPPGHGLPPLPPISIPPNPWSKPSTCSADQWKMSDFFCHWKKVSPFQTTVGMMFGKSAKRKYGNMTLLQALQGRDDLLKQAVAATMNSYINPKFSMSPRGVKNEFLTAMKGPQKLKWETAWKLKQANGGWGKGKCYLTPCKS